MQILLFPAIINNRVAQEGPTQLYWVDFHYLVMVLIVSVIDPSDSA